MTVNEGEIEYPRLPGVDQNASTNDSGAGSSQPNNTQPDQQKPISGNHPEQPKQNAPDSNENNAGASKEAKSSNYEKPSVDNETDEQWELNNDILKYAREEKGLSKDEFQQQGRREADRIKYVDANDVEGLWGLHPADLEDGKRGLHLKLLKFLVHPDKHPNPSDELKADLENAFRKLEDTTKYVNNPPRKDTKTTKKATGHVIGKVGDQYIKIYNSVEFLRALDTLFTNPANEAAIQTIETINEQTIKPYNSKNKQGGSVGVVPIRELVKFYAKAHRIIEGFAGASKEDKEKKQVEMERLFKESEAFCKGCGLPRSFSWPSLDCHRAPYFWRNSDKKREKVDDKILTAEEWRQMAEAAGSSSSGGAANSGPPGAGTTGSNPSGTGTSTGSGPSSAGATGSSPSGTGTSTGSGPFSAGAAGSGPPGAGTPQTMPLVTSSFIGFKLAREHQLTFDGKKMLAAKRVGGGDKGGWLIIVNEGTEEQPIYRFRSGKDCGGKLIINGIVNNLPRLGHHDEAFLAQEKKAEESTFEQLLGIAQVNTQTWCNTAWKGKDPFWISRTKLSECLGSSSMVDQMVQELGAELPLRKEEKEQLMDLVLAAPQVPEPAATNGAPGQMMISQAQILAQGRLGVALSRRIKHRAFPAPSANSVAQQLSAFRL